MRFNFIEPFWGSSSCVDFIWGRANGQRDEEKQLIKTCAYKWQRI